MDADEQTSHQSQSTEDIEREAKRARLLRIQTMKRGPRIRKLPELNRNKVDPSVYQYSERLARHARRVAECLPKQLQRLRLQRLGIEIKEDETALSEKTVEVMRPCDSVHFQHSEESQPPCEGYATLNPGTDAHLSELPWQHEQAELPESSDRSNNTPAEYCMSDEFIERLGRQVRLYYSMVKPLPQKEIIANGLQHMNDEAFSAFHHYVAEKDLFEGFDYKFGELLHHCFSFEEHRKVYSHYNFTIEMKKKDEKCWTPNHYFAEAKLILGVKYYFCSPLKVTDDGQCYSCMNQGVNELKHPSGGGYEKGHEGSGSHCGYADSSDDDECA
ncbi:unnamed protein product [Urochloa decumbens]|uniref:DUF3615 domain-containing protein n=1 Tax=Urochloa decumbens TaxID=240449 RepID=A0ABC8YNP8_9POAL